MSQLLRSQDNEKYQRLGGSDDSLAIIFAVLIQSLGLNLGYHTHICNATIHFKVCHLAAFRQHCIDAYKEWINFCHCVIIILDIPIICTITLSSTISNHVIYCFVNYACLIYCNFSMHLTILWSIFNQYILSIYYLYYIMNDISVN